MHTFLASARYPFYVSALFAVAAIAAFGLHLPAQHGLAGESYVVLLIQGVAIGPIAGLISFLFAGILNGLRRMLHIRQLALLHPITVLLSIAPWGVMSWLILGASRDNIIEITLMDFYARPLAWGAAVAGAAAVALALPLLAKNGEHR